MEWVFVLRGDGKSARSVEGYTDSVRHLPSFLSSKGFPRITQVTAEHVREWLGALRERGNKPATVNTRVIGGFTSLPKRKHTEGAVEQAMAASRWRRSVQEHLKPRGRVRPQADLLQDSEALPAF